MLIKNIIIFYIRFFYIQLILDEYLVNHRSDGLFILVSLLFDYQFLQTEICRRILKTKKYLLSFLRIFLEFILGRKTSWTLCFLGNFICCCFFLFWIEFLTTIPHFVTVASRRHLSFAVFGQDFLQNNIRKGKGPIITNQR